jgi:hypothetical protein
MTDIPRQAVRKKKETGRITSNRVEIGGKEKEIHTKGYNRKERTINANFSIVKILQYTVFSQHSSLLILKATPCATNSVAVISFATTRAGATKCAITPASIQVLTGK